MTGAADGVDLLADHSVLLAIPAFLPAFAVVGIIVLIAVRDRRAERRESEQNDRAPSNTDEEFQ
ncbi:hypothetical protein [Nocardia amikacinitolerans]|uniref:hypothetical protein n=1 Tax=Nocardia amikacinitolerans TaxID=756689 RepID=UPI0020A56CDD|nr:hypothetical protein [Nocardia amikacinitolerans]MCP2277986.1 hypothetical protein [Nocardia amikacinitolerans]MCP2296561.1 hypothetical protein [Nocardia amikacinitolerans]MCP2321122.1 hypothetical protein [Nocardia amikacinitolerans]